ncbi:S-malonyltransferase, variant 2 [Capsaspora owczarzaki ATCC 30864]|uniref:[acyl-carrier-protein] S-malonyltransferase n=1 Tax=Capsaspora owczarzaki (strain ATCC 30864) TaxID=595528 RepID=A0A0D2WJ36_CAPO3|nr:S-malonyltransferase, variant 2 [Capsaspora owczarzaki ATCC 30864]
MHHTLSFLMFRICCSRLYSRLATPGQRRLTAFCFPGQGTQTVGMGKDLADAHPVARRTFDEVDAALNDKLSHLMFNGPLDKLTLTANAQPAILAHSIALLRVIEEKTGILPEQFGCYLGHSLGEYSALVATQAISLSAAASIVRLRGEAMQGAFPGTLRPRMVALLPTTPAALQPILQSVNEQFAASATKGTPTESCDIANVNTPKQVWFVLLEAAEAFGFGARVSKIPPADRFAFFFVLRRCAFVPTHSQPKQQVVLSGSETAVARVVDAALFSKVARRSVDLNISAPFHSRWMAPAADALRQPLGRIKWRDPMSPVISNVTAAEVWPKDLPAAL